MADCNPETNGELRFARLLAPTCSVIFDVGARTDDDLPRLNPEAECHLFDPLPEHVAELKAKLGDSKNCTINEIGLAEEAGDKQLFPDSQSVFERPGSTADPVPIHMERLDRYCRDNGVSSIDFLKIDTEGYELKVLEGGGDIVRHHTRVIQFEYGGTYLDAGIELKDVFRYLGRQWHFYRIEPTGLYPIPRYQRSLEDFEYSNYVASRTELGANHLSASAPAAGRWNWLWRRR